MSAETRAAIAAVNRTFMDNFARQDAAAMAALYTADGQLLPTNSDFVTGPAAIQEFWGGEGIEGVLVGAVAPGGPAERAGLLPGDLVVSVDGRPVGSASDLMRRVSSGGIGNELLIEVSRQGTWLDVALTVDEEPPREELEELEKAPQRGSRR